MKFRNEWKYLISSKNIILTEEKIKNVLKFDPFSKEYGKYRVRSLYFDDYCDKCARDNELGVSIRYKWRIRYYNNFDGLLKLEKKYKYFGRCKKLSCKITIDEYNKIINNDVCDVFWNTDSKLLKEFCIDILTKYFRPKVIIDYVRIAYIEDISNVRITFDTNISASYEFDKFIDGDYMCYPLNNLNEEVLEVKFDDILPSYIKNLISNKFYIRTSFSKYYNGRKVLEGVTKL